ncbi:MAG: BON domain-containing protein [Candidatus Aminicenantes bacterium]|nr:BON domain-containing protein [Candidatus Aminicenantes bacterium]
MNELMNKKHQEMVMSRLTVSMLIAIIVTLLMITGYLFAADMDGQIAAAAAKTVACKTRLKGDDIRVRCQDGVVALTGTMASAPHSLLAAETVADLPGVTRVANRTISE